MSAWSLVAGAVCGAEENRGELFGGQFADPIEDPVSDHGYNGVHGKHGNLHANDRAER